MVGIQMGDELYEFSEQREFNVLRGRLKIARAALKRMATGTCMLHEPGDPKCGAEISAEALKEMNAFQGRR